MEGSQDTLETLRREETTQICRYRRWNRTRLWRGLLTSTSSHNDAQTQEKLYSDQAKKEDGIRSRRLSQDARPDPYDYLYCFLIVRTFACEWNVLLSLAQSYAEFKDYSSCWVYGQLPTSSTTGLSWWISPLQDSNWIALKKFILEERSYTSVGAIIIFLIEV